MEPTIILEFLGGVIGGAFLSVLILKSSSHKRNQPKKPQTRVLSPKKNKTNALIGGEARRGRPRARVSKVTPLALQKEASIEPPLLEVRTAFLSCPSCGLEAPENLMTEHLIGSPSHKYAPAKPQTVLASAIDPNDSARKTSGDESTDSVRHLLQMLVPPRAFGRRHRQRVVNPLSNIVSRMGPGRDQ